MLVNTLIIGGGPAGIAPLLSASRSGSLERLLADGVAIVERTMTVGPGRLGGYAVRSDSTGKTLVSCVTENAHPVLAALASHPATQAVAAFESGSVPLTSVARFMEVVGAALAELVRATGNAVFLGHEALGSSQTVDGLWQTRLRSLANGDETIVFSRFLVLATGGHQPLSYLARRKIGGKPLLPTHAAKLMQSDEALTPAGLAAIGARLASARNKRIAVVGSSSSALACVHACLNAAFGRELGAGSVTLLHRRPLRIFYPSVADALAEGYAEFGADDICPISGFVYRLSGLRLEARELVMAARGIGARPSEPRLRLHQVSDAYDPVALQLLDEADVVVGALGYRARGLPLATAKAGPLALYGDRFGQVFVDSECRVLDRRGKPIAGLLGIGLGSGFFSREIVGGELSFSGQTNSLWQWQNAVGGLIAQQVQRTQAAEHVAPVAGAGLSVLSPLQAI
jgi:hypothetical protein